MNDPKQTPAPLIEVVVTLSAVIGKRTVTVQVSGRHGTAVAQEAKAAFLELSVM